MQKSFGLRAFFILGLSALAIVGAGVSLSPGVAVAAKRTTPKLPSDAVPAEPQDRHKVLNELYTRLASAEDDNSAKMLAGAIEQMWLYSGSDTVNLLMERAIQALGKEDRSLALKLLDAVIGLAPDYAEGWNRRAYVLFLDNDYSASVADLKQVLRLDPNHFKAIDGLGHILREVGDKAGALMTYRYLLKVNPYADGAKDVLKDLEKEVQGDEL